MTSKFKLTQILLQIEEAGLPEPNNINYESGELKIDGCDDWFVGWKTERNAFDLEFTWGGLWVEHKKLRTYYSTLKEAIARLKELINES